MKNANPDTFAAQAELLAVRQISLGVTLALGLIDQCQTPLLPDERILEKGITQSRLREVRAGRTIARHAMQYLGAQPGPILMNPTTGAPIWPEGYCGSLSHTSQYVAAVVALSTRYDAVGVDIDDRRPLGAAVSDIVTSAELQVLSDAIGNRMISPECLGFCIKEAIFKCQWPLTNDSALDFLDISITQGKEEGSMGFCVNDSKRTLLARIAPHIQTQLVEMLGIEVICALLPKQ